MKKSTITPGDEALISEALAAHEDETALKKIRGEVEKMCEQFPLYEKRLVRSQAQSN